MFICLGWIASIMLDTLSTNKNFKQLSLKHNRDGIESPSIKWEIKILGWKRKYLIISELVDQLQRSFSLILLVITTSQFIRMITSSFRLMRRIQNEDWTGSFSIFARLFIELTHFIPLIYTPYRIRNKVIIE